MLMVCSRESRFAYMIFIVKDQDKIYLASETGRITVLGQMVIVQGLDRPN